MITISDALNTHNYSIDILKKKGYSIFLKDEDEDYLLYLVKKEIKFQSEDPLSLLSLVYLTENKLLIDEDRIDRYMDNYSAYSIKVMHNDKGFNIKILDNGDWYDWTASKGDRKFFASSPLKLLGLILMIEEFGENWQDIVVPLYLNEL